MANVFISHRGCDDALAAQLAGEIRTAGHDIWIDEERIDIGDSIVQRINEGLEGASYLVLCCSSAGVMSPWMSREWMSALARQLNGAGVKVLPVRLSGGDLPAILADVKYADTAADWANGVGQLLKAIR
jgi:hypothetical protein